jgi:penicillin-binding protein 1C
MVKQDFISTGRMKGVLKEKTILKPQPSTFQAPHLVFYLAEKLTDGTQTVVTTLDAHLQAMVREQISLTLSKLKPFHVTNAAAILLDNHSGELLAYCGSADFFDSRIDGQYDGIQALRQPGSALKPFLYLLAMEEGMHPASLISDVPSHYRMPTGIYSPKNYSENFHGPIRLREALANSLNVPAVRTLAGVGVENFLHRLKRYEFQSLQKQPEFYGLGLALGCGEVSLYELTRAYMCLARMGKFQPVREFININGKKIDLVTVTKQISSETLNYLIFDILNDNYARTSEFGFHSVLNLPFPCAAKTGTSFRFCDNWTIGYTADYTLGVWVGNFDHSPMLKVSGISGAGPLFARIMLMLYSERDYPSEPVRPEGIRDVTICLLSGRRPGPYCSTTGSDIIPEDNLPAWNSSICLMHEFEAEKASLRLPRQYQDWAGQLGLQTGRLPMDRAVFEIVNPKAGAIYRRLPNLAPGYQSIRFQLRGSHPDLTVRWFLNDELIKSTCKNHEFLWQSVPGEYTLRAVSASDHQLVSTVEFRVQ